MKPRFARATAVILSGASFLTFGNVAEAASFPVLETLRSSVASPAQYGPYRRYSPLQQYSPNTRQNSIAGRAAFCRCFPYAYGSKRLVCRYPGRPTTVQIVRNCY
jgi:hypothetical protein